MALGTLVIQPAVADTVGTITRFNVQTSPTPTVPEAITAGPDGNMWFTDASANLVGRITPAGSTQRYFLPHPSSSPSGIATGPDGNLWFTESAGNRIGRISPTGIIDEFDLPYSTSQPTGIAAGSDGAMWFTEYAGNQIGRITMAGHIDEFVLPPVASNPKEITLGPDGAMWFTQPGHNAIGRISPAGEFSQSVVPTGGSGLQGIAAGPDGNIWFAESSALKIGRLTPSGVFTEFASSGPPRAMAAGSDGNVWFTEYPTGKLGRITPSGAVTEFSANPWASSASLHAGPDGDMWFTEGINQKVSRIGTGKPNPLLDPPTISGTLRAGDAQTCSGERWDTWSGDQPGSTTVTWSLNGTVVPGATSRSYTPSKLDVGETLTCSLRTSYAMLPVPVVATSEGKPVLPPVVGPAPRDPSAGQLLWTNTGAALNGTTIGASGADGWDQVNALVDATPGTPYGVALDSDHIYWASPSTNSIGRASRSGTSVEPDFIQLPGATPVDVTVDAGHVYWTDPLSGAIGRAALNGTSVQTSFIATGATPYGFTVDSTRVYWANGYGGTSIGRANLDGTAVTTNWITGANDPRDVAVGFGHIFWSNVGDDTIGRANLDGTAVNQALVSGADTPYGLAVNSRWLYWANQGADDGRTIGRSDLSGDDPDQSFIVGASSPIGLAVDRPSVALSPTQVTFGTTAQGTVSGSRELVLTNGGSASLTVSGFTVTGTSAGDYLIGQDTCRGAIPAGGTCTVPLRFAPQATGTRNATVTVVSNAPEVATVVVTGLGGALPTGPTGPQGATGQTGQTGAQGAPGRDAKVTCTVKGAKKPKVSCKVRVVSGVSSVAWSLTQHKRTIAAGRAHVRKHTVTLPLSRITRMGNGRYVLVVDGSRTSLRIRAG